MDRSVFDQCYIELRKKYGADYFGSIRAKKLFEILKDVADDDAKKCIDLILVSDFYSSDRPPDSEAFKQALTKVQTERKREEYRKERSKPEILGWESINPDGLSQALKNMGYESTSELIKNGFRPRKV